MADRGNLKAFRVDETASRGASLKLVQAGNITDAHGHHTDKLTDNAGRFLGSVSQHFYTYGTTCWNHVSRS